MSDKVAHMRETQPNSLNSVVNRSTEYPTDSNASSLVHRSLPSVFNKVGSLAVAEAHRTIDLMSNTPLENQPSPPRSR